MNQTNNIYRWIYIRDNKDSLKARLQQTFTHIKLIYQTSIINAEGSYLINIYIVWICSVYKL